MFPLLGHPGVPGSEHCLVVRRRDALAVEPPFTLVQTSSPLLILYAIMEDADQIPLWLTMQLKAIDGK